MLELFITFFKIGLFTFGGGYAMIPLIQQQINLHHWLSNSDFINFIAVSESTPGPFAVNISTFIGTRTYNIPGALCATLGVVLPSFIVILIVARYFNKFKDSKAVKGIMTGLKPAVVGMIGSSVVSVGSNVFFSSGITFNESFFISLGIFIIMSLLTLKKVHPIIIIVLSAIIGIISGYFIL